ncbi:hypothetical protein [Blastomonas aquatica]|nr:hypothetical protein [Blastomonas aquatica]
MIALPETADGEISPDCIAMLTAELTGYDAVVFGPAMVKETAVATLLAAL